MTEGLVSCLLLRGVLGELVGCSIGKDGVWGDVWGCQHGSLELSPKNTTPP
jgi:hypothetical protein